MAISDKVDLWSSNWAGDTFNITHQGPHRLIVFEIATILCLNQSGPHIQSHALATHDTVPNLRRVNALE